MAISDRIRAEARRTIDGIQKYYEKCGADLEDAEEREHRIARIEAAMEGCNGLSPDDKVQKTAENVFELTCSQERSFNIMRMDIKRLRDENNKEFDTLRGEIKTGMQEIVKKIEDSGRDCAAHAGPASKAGEDVHGVLGFMTKIISEHPLLTFAAFMSVLILVFVSGHFELLAKLVGK